MNLKLRLVLLISLYSFTCLSQSWSGLGSGTSAGVRSLYYDSSTSVLFVGGNFTYAGGTKVDCIATWDGNNWDSLGGGVVNFGSCNPILTITKYKGDIYSAGEFFGSEEVIAKWNGVSWDSIASVVGSVVRLRVIDGELYATGTFSSIGGVSATHVAKWDGSAWSDLNTDFIGGAWTIADVIKYDGSVYIAGNFLDTSGTIENIAKWDGTTWSPVGNGILGSIAWINVLQEFDGRLMACGLFDKADGNAGDNIAMWDGAKWNDVGGGTGGAVFPQIRDCVVKDNELVVAGAFTSAGGVPASKIAKWDGVQWCGLGSSFDNNISAIAFSDTSLFVGGGFLTIDGDTMTRVAHWNGNFVPDTCGVISGITKVRNGRDQVAIYPNPFCETATFTTTLQSDLSFSLYDLLGREVIHIEKRNSNTLQIERGKLPRGIYIYRLGGSERVIGAGKLVIQ
ncbi:MAG: T9SS type A sorting domain-containing protein [Bacteroidetes bacterium]|nr:T9SS type A sorting domain-containing protein [Bacteroidota bacterium]